jgi:hypothetical protein
VLRYDNHPTALRLLAALGGAGMTIAPALAWAVMWNFAGRPVREAGLESEFGVVVLVVGLMTLVTAGLPHLLPLNIVTGLIGGAAAGLYLVDVLAFRFVPDSATEVELGLVLALGSAAVTGAAGIAALAVAAAVSVRPGENQTKVIH